MKREKKRPIADSSRNLHLAQNMVLRFVAIDARHAASCCRSEMESLQGRDTPRDTFNRKEDTTRAFFPDSKLNREGAEIDG